MVDKCLTNPSRPQLPLLVFCLHPWYDHSNYCFLRFSDNKVIKPYWPELSRRHCGGCVQGGYLAMCDGFLWCASALFESCSPFPFCKKKKKKFEIVNNFLLNPLSGSQISLPSQSTLPCSLNFYPHFFSKVVCSTIPTSTDCVVASLTFDCQLAYCRPSDERWTLIENNYRGGVPFWDIEFYDGKLYALSYHALNLIVAFDLCGAPPLCSRPNVEFIEMLNPQPLPTRNVRNGDLHSNVMDFQLVKHFASNDLLVVVKILDFVHDSFFGICLDKFLIPPLAKGFQVFRLDKSSGPQWIPVESFGDQILFLS